MDSGIAQEGTTVQSGVKHMPFGRLRGEDEQRTHNRRSLKEHGNGYSEAGVAVQVVDRTVQGVQHPEEVPIGPDGIGALLREDAMLRIPISDPIDEESLRFEIGFRDRVLASLALVRYAQLPLPVFKEKCTGSPGKLSSVGLQLHQ